MNNKKPQIPGGYLVFPHRIIKRAIATKAINAEGRALICSLYQGLGNENNVKRGFFQLGLSMLMKHGNMTRAEASKARAALLSKGILLAIKDADILHAKAAEFRLNLNSFELETVSNSKQSENEEQFRIRNGGCFELETVNCFELETVNCFELETLDNITLNNITSNKHFSDNNTPPSPSFRGELENAEKRVSEPFSFSKSLKDSKGLRPVTHQGEKPPGPQRPNTNPKPLIELFEGEMGLAANLTKTEIREFSELMQGCNRNLYQSAFIKFIMEIKGKPIPDRLKRPGDICMLIARAAVNIAKGQGG
jgi:hypothetical protein